MRSGAPEQPVSPGAAGNGGGEKNKKNFYARLNRLIEENMRLKVQQRELKEVNADFLK